MGAAPPAVMCNYFVAPGVRARVSINDVPLLPSPVEGSHSEMLSINHRLIEGENIARAEIELTGPEVIRTELDKRGVDRFAIHVYQGQPGDRDSLQILAEFELTSAWKGVAEAGRRYPFQLSVPFTTDAPVAPPAYVTATPTSVVPCEGTVELHDFVRRYYDAEVARDKATIVALSEPFLSDYERAHPGHASATRSARIAQIDQLHAQDPQFLPLESEALHFEARAAGRIVYVTRLGGGGVIRSSTKDAQLECDLLLMRTAQGWRVM